MTMTGDHQLYKTLSTQSEVSVKPLKKRRFARWHFILLVIGLVFISSCIFAGLIGASFGTSKQPCSEDTPKDAVRAKRDESHVDLKYHSKGQKRRLPQAIVVGVRKCGTRALLEFLNLHPQIRAASDEIHFFDNDDNYRYGLEWYRKRMPYSYPDQITIEKSPAYFITEEVPQRIFAMNSSVKILVIVRDPTVRTISDYTQIHHNKIARNKTHLSFEQLAIDQNSGNVNLRLKAVRTSMYSKHMERWLEVFKKQQIHIVNGDNLIKNPLEEISGVENFLGLENRIKNDNFYFNKTKGFYCMRTDSGQDKCLGRRKGRKHPSVNPVVIKKLNNFFRPYNERFFEMTGVRMNWPLK